MKKHLPKIIFLSLLILFLILYFILGLNKYFNVKNMTAGSLLTVKNFFVHYQIIGPIIIIILFTIFNLAILPTFYFIFLSGYLYGPIYGFFIAWIGMILGLTVSFINSRYLFRNDFNRRFGQNKIVDFLDRYHEKYHGWSVLLFRIFFIVPYNMQNIAYGLTKIKIFTYILSSAIGVIPSTFLWIILADFTANNKLSLSSVKDIYLTVIIIISVFASIFFTTILLKKKFKLNMKK